MDYKSTLIAVMGLEANATDEVIANAATTFQTEMVNYKNELDAQLEKVSNTAKVLEAERDALKEEVTTLSNTADKLTKEIVAHDLERFSGVISNRAEIEASLLANREATLKILAGIKQGATPKVEPPLHNSGNGQPAPVETGGEVVPESVAKRIANRAREMRSTIKGLSYQQSFIAAQAEEQKARTN